MHRITIMGNAAVDALCHVEPELIKTFNFRPGDIHFLDVSSFTELSSRCDISEFQAGGSTANVADTLARLGEDVFFVSRFGVDPASRHFLSEMKAAGVQMLAPEEGSRTMEIFVLITPDGERTFVTGGVMSPLLPEMVNDNYFSHGEWLLAEGFMLLDQYDAVREGLYVARKNNVKTAVTLASTAIIEQAFENIATEIEKGVDLLIGNEEELAALMAKVESNDARDGEILKGALARTNRLVTRSGKGATFYAADGSEISVPADEITSPVDTTGAGDAFAAGFLFHYMRTGDVERGMALGHRLARAVIMQVGARLKDLPDEVTSLVAPA